MEYYLTKGIDVLTILSNLAFIIPTIGAAKQRRWTRAFVYFLMIWASFTYHLCDSFDACLFTFNEHHFIDFFFAQFLIFLSGLYFVEYSPKYPYAERFLIITSAIIVVILEITLGGELIVQGAIVGVVLFGILVYWIIRGSVPKYNMKYLALGVTLTSLSVTLYVYQNILPQSYWSIHSLWHLGGSLGQYYLLFIKRAAPRYMAADSRIRYRY